MQRDSVFAPDHQLDRLVSLAMSLGSNHNEALTHPHCVQYTEYLMRKPLDYFENMTVSPRHLAKLFLDCRQTSDDSNIESLREADRLHFGLCGRKQDREAAADIYDKLAETNKEAKAMITVHILII